MCPWKSVKASPVDMILCCLWKNKKALINFHYLLTGFASFWSITLPPFVASTMGASELSQKHLTWSAACSHRTWSSQRVGVQLLRLQTGTSRISHFEKLCSNLSEALKHSFERINCQQGYFKSTWSVCQLPGIARQLPPGSGSHFRWWPCGGSGSGREPGWDEFPSQRKVNWYSMSTWKWNCDRAHEL